MNEQAMEPIVVLWSQWSSQTNRGRKREAIQYPLGLGQGEGRLGASVLENWQKGEREIRRHWDKYFTLKGPQ